MNFFKYCSIILLTFILVGCSSNSQDSLIISKRVVDNQISEGRIYSLPKQLVKITYKKEFIDPKKTKAKIKKIKTSIDSLKKSSNEKKTALNNIKSLVKNINTKLPENDKLLAKYNLEIVKEEASLAILQNDLLKLDGSKKTYKRTLVIKPLSVKADKDNSYTANFNHEITHSEKLNIKLKNGMLSGSVGYSDDKTNDIIISLASSIFTLTSGTSLNPQTKSYLGILPTCNREGEIEISRTLDPLEKTELANFSNILSKNACIKIAIADNFVKIKNRVTAANKSADLINGLVYQQPGVVNFKIKDDEDNELYIERVFLAQGGHTGFISMPSGRFTKNEYSFSFSSGMLVESDTTRPSELLGALMIIPNTIKGIFALPTELIKLKVDYSSNEKNLTEIEQSIITALVEIKKKQAELDGDVDTDNSVD